MILAAVTPGFAVLGTTGRAIGASVGGAGRRYVCGSHSGVLFCLFMQKNDPCCTLASLYDLSRHPLPCASASENTRLNTTVCLQLLLRRL